MIILPDRHREVGKLLVPMRRSDWIEASARPSFSPIEHGTRTRWRLTAKLDDGFIVWRGWFDDRDDADAFLFAMASGTLEYQPALWDLPSPAWRPGMGEHLNYDFATVTFLTAVTATNWTVPVDWNNGNNKVEAIGGGSSGDGPNGRPGAGGAYARSNNVVLTKGASISYTAGNGGNGSTAASSSAQSGLDTTFNGGTTLAKGSPRVSNGRCLGGLASTSVGDVKFSGGDGSTQANGAGGGAAGPNGAGSVTTNYVGGVGDAGFGGAGGTNPRGTGGNGTEWDATHGSGGGGGGSSNTGNGGNGGNYGAGAGGAAGAGQKSGNAAQGIVVITYTPFIATFNMPNLGM